MKDLDLDTRSPERLGLPLDEVGRGRPLRVRPGTRDHQHPDRCGHGQARSRSGPITAADVPSRPDPSATARPGSPGASPGRTTRALNENIECGELRLWE